MTKKALSRAGVEPAPLGNEYNPSELPFILIVTFNPVHLSATSGGARSFYLRHSHESSFSCMGKRPSGPANGLAPTCKKSLNNLVEKRALDSVFYQALVHIGHVT